MVVKNLSLTWYAQKFEWMWKSLSLGTIHALFMCYIFTCKEMKEKKRNSTQSDTIPPLLVHNTDIFADHFPHHSIWMGLGKYVNDISGV